MGDPCIARALRAILCRQQASSRGDNAVVIVALGGGAPASIPHQVGPFILVVSWKERVPPRTCFEQPRLVFIRSVFEYGASSDQVAVWQELTIRVLCQAARTSTGGIKNLVRQRKLIWLLIAVARQGQSAGGCPLSVTSRAASLIPAASLTPCGTAASPQLATSMRVGMRLD
jgi:hypothetical protein